MKRNVIRKWAFVIAIPALLSVWVSCKKDTGNNSDNNPGDGNHSPKPSVSFYLTNTDQTAMFTLQPLLYWTTTINSDPDITIDTTVSYQTIDGFGFCLTEGSAQVISGLSSGTQNTLLTDLFSTNGIGISVIRISIGASDMSESDYSYQDGGSSAAFSLSGPDSIYLIPLIKKILAINPDIKILATPWSAPIWMKSNNNWTGGSLDTAYYDDYANYFKNYLDAMKAQGIDIWAITPQNEPENPYNEPSMTMTKEEETDFINNYLGPVLENAGYNTKIICYDHNCDDTNYPTYVCNNSSYVDGSAFHLYAGSISALTTVKNATGKNVYFTEQYTGSNGSFAGDFPWHMQNVMLGSVNNWAKAALEWNLATNTSYGPHTPGGCTTCLGGITVTGSTSYTKNVSYFIVAHMSKFIRPNAVRVSSTSTDNSLLNAAFVSDTSKVLVVFNSSGSPKSFNIVNSGKSVQATLAAGSAGTFVWK